jgi:hypothetical protein
MRKRKKRYHTGEFNSTKMKSVSKFRSGWEHKYMMLLDVDSNVKEWYFENIKIPYVSNKKTGKVRNYYPDFTVIHEDGSKHIIEIKPKRKLGNATVKKKCSAAIDWCMEHGYHYKIITEIELKQLGVL